MSNRIISTFALKAAVAPAKAGAYTARSGIQLLLHHKVSQVLYPGHALREYVKRYHQAVAWIPAFAGMTVFWFSAPALAASNEACNNEVFSPDGDLCVTITANRFKQPLKYVGASTTIITREEIQRQNIRNVADALKRVPGAALARTGGFGSTTNIRLRGSDSGQVRVIIDGVTVNDPTNTENFYDFSTLLTTDIDRIEVIRGPQSSLWGADTTGGVINIITQKGATIDTSQAFAEIGSYQTYRAGASHYGSEGKVNYGVSAQHLTSQGFSRIAAIPTEKDGTQSSDVKGNIGFQLADNAKLDFSGGYSLAKADFDPAASIDGPAHQDKREYYGTAKATMQHLDGQLEQSLLISHFNVDRDVDEPLGFFRYSTYAGRRTQATYQTELALRKRDVASLGLDWQRDGASTTSTRLGITSAGINRDINNKALFGQYVFGITESWTLTGGARVDDHSQFGIQPTYRFTTAYNIDSTGTTLRATYGTGFKAPSLFQLYAAGFGNANLDPEESKAFDLGIEQHLLNDRIKISVTSFKSEVDNLITFTTGYQNVKAAEVKGIESSASFGVTSNLLLSGNHTYLLTEDISTHRSLPRRPKHTAAISLDYDISERAHVGSEVLYTSSQFDRGSGNLRVKSHTTTNVNASLDVDQNTTLYANLENIFDKDYEEIVGFQAPGFTAYVGVRTNF